MGHLDQQISDFLLEVHASSRELEPLAFQRRTLDRIRDALDFDFAIWGAGDGQERHVHTATIVDQDPNLFATWEPVKHEDPFANLVIGNTGRTWALDDLPAPALETRAYNEHWRRYDARQMLSTMELDPQTGLHVFVTLCRDSRRLLYTERERQLKGLVTRHLFLAARHNERFALLRHADPAGVAIVDWRGRVHSSMGEFSDLLAQEWGASARRQLPLELADLRRGCHRGRHVQLSFIPLGDRFIAKAEPCSPLALLSGREREIAQGYARGLSHKEVARALAISPNTVRNHLQSIYRKLHIRDKTALALLCRD
ncbi:MAG: response regulator transcription factor [Pseudomonadota bacterium]